MWPLAWCPPKSDRTPHASILTSILTRDARVIETHLVVGRRAAAAPLDVRAADRDVARSARQHVRRRGDARERRRLGGSIVIRAERPMACVLAAHGRDDPSRDASRREAPSLRLWGVGLEPVWPTRRAALLTEVAVVVSQALADKEG